MLYKVGKGRLEGEFVGEGSNLRCGRDLADQEQPEHGFGKHLRAGWSFWEERLAIRDAMTVEADAFIRVED